MLFRSAKASSVGANTVKFSPLANASARPAAFAAAIKVPNTLAPAAVSTILAAKADAPNDIAKAADASAIFIDFKVVFFMCVSPGNNERSFLRLTGEFTAHAKSRIINKIVSGKESRTRDFGDPKLNQKQSPPDWIGRLCSMKRPDKLLERV